MPLGPSRAQPRDVAAPMLFGALLRRHRQAAGITQGFLAERAGLSPAAVSALERGRRLAPYRATVALLAVALGLSAEQRAELESAADAGRARGVRLGSAQAWSSLGPAFDKSTNNLPTQLTSFIGRETELAELSTLLMTHRLITVTGSGGVGKTRTSLACAEHLIDGFGDGVWLIELAPLASGGYIPSTVAQALRLTLAPTGDALENLVRALAGKRALLVFDNCEHLTDPAARVLVAILRGCPDVKVIATSRHVLGIGGEVTYRMPSLDVDAAVTLFVERARDADSRFALTDENASIVADICRRLDGIPLALEMASSRVTMLSPRQVRERLDERFRMLTGGSRDALPRQQTLRALIDWSHDLLDEHERVLFRRLAIFVNGFVLEAAEFVASGEDADDRGVFALLASLVDKSLVLAEPVGDSVRYRLLESTRAYASEKLDDAGERDLVASRHLRYFRDRFAQLWEQTERTARRADLVSAFRTELEDLRSALDGALTRSEIIDGAELLCSNRSWQAIGRESEGMAWCEKFLAALPPDERRLRARLSTELSFSLSVSGHPVRAFALATEAVELARASRDGSSLAWALRMYAYTAAALDRFDDAERALEQAEALRLDSANFRVTLLGMQADICLIRRDYEKAVTLYEQLLVQSRALGNVRNVLATTANLAEVEHARGRTQRAIALVREIIPAVQSAANESLLISTHQNLAGYLVAVDDLSGAAEAAYETIRITATREPDHLYFACAVEHLALVVALRGDAARAAVLEGYADDALRRHGFLRQHTEAQTYGRLTALLDEKLTPDERLRETAKGSALTPEAAVALALEVRAGADAEGRRVVSDER